MEPLTPLQKNTAQAIVNIFETGRPFGDYARVSVLAGDAGHLSYGRSQVSLASGMLGELLTEYAGRRRPRTAFPSNGSCPGRALAI